MCVEFQHENMTIGIERRADLRAFKVIVVATKAKRLLVAGEPVEEQGFAFYVHDNWNSNSGYGRPPIATKLLDGDGIL